MHSRCIGMSGKACNREMKRRFEERSLVVPRQKPAPLQRPPTIVATPVKQVPLATPPPHVRQVPLVYWYCVALHLLTRGVVEGDGVVEGAGVVCTSQQRAPLMHRLGLLTAQLPRYML